MNKKILFSFFLFLFLNTFAYSYKILYAEQWYKLFHIHFYQYPERCAENIHYLEEALRADFANPLNALARINNKTEWELYRYLFYTHVNLKLVEQYLLWGSKYDKQVAYFYNYPWKQANLKSLEKAEKLYRYALVYWEEAKKWSSKTANFQFLFLTDIQYWHDESYRIQTGELDYEDIINEQLTRLEKVRSDFLKMDHNTY